MFRKRGLLLLMVSVVMGVGAAWVARNWVAQQAAADDKPDVRTVVAAALAMPFGTTVEERHLRIIEMPEDSAPPGSYREVSEVLGKVTTQPIVAGEILMKARFVEQGSGSTLAAM
ncbi:MAG: Flp pilus assembly protein CpaB, partial [Thiohalobacterales bacterium]|nr:Flp pilus assembly protein CpaB [Thiohalobacterales bacterium]